MSRRDMVVGVTIVGVAISTAILGLPGMAWADSSTPNAVLPSDLWIAPLAGGSAALVVIVIAVTKSFQWKGWVDPVPSTSAWDVQDSWVTNITAVGGALTAVFSATAITSFFKNTNTDGFTVVSLLFAGATAMGPVVYGAFATKPTAGSSAPSGTRVGLVLASFVTLFAAFGLMADIGQLVSYTIGTTPEKSLVFISLGAAAFVVGIYAVRSTNAMVNVTSAGAGGMIVAASMMTPTSRTSGTL